MFSLFYILESNNWDKDEEYNQEDVLASPEPNNPLAPDELYTRILPGRNNRAININPDNI